MAKNKNEDCIRFIGENAIDVTGSCTLIEFNGKKILLECGLWQSNNYLEAYNVNTKKFKFKPSEIDYCFVGHPHIDHIGLLPRLVKEGFKGKIIMSDQAAIFAKPLLINSSFILDSVARQLSYKFERVYDPIYTKEDVFRTMDFVYEFKDIDKIYKLDDTVSFQFLKNSHCVGARQIQLILTSDIKTKKILYTSDIGMLNANNHFVDNTEIPNFYNDVTIMESTYGERSRQFKKTRDFDREKIKAACETVLERGGTVIFPAFSYSRTQELVVNLYEIFHKAKEFNYEIDVDSQLSCEITDDYSEALSGDDLKLWKKVIAWKNIRLIEEKVDSVLCIKDKKPKIVITSSGFCTNGRVLSWLKEYLKDTNSAVIFSGYTGADNSYLAYRIKNSKEHEKIRIDKEVVDNEADCYTLASFSSHANRDDLLKYGSSIRTGVLVLVHGSDKAKCELKEDLLPLISANDNSYKVNIAQKDMVVRL